MYYVDESLATTPYLTIWGYYSKKSINITPLKLMI